MVQTLNTGCDTSLHWRFLVPTFRYQGAARLSSPLAELANAQSDMLQPLTQLKELIWLEYRRGIGDSVPWPELPLSLESLDLLPGKQTSSVVLRVQ